MLDTRASATLRSINCMPNNDICPSASVRPTLTVCPQYYNRVYSVILWSVYMPHGFMCLWVQIQGVGRRMPQWGPLEGLGYTSGNWSLFILYMWTITVNNSGYVVTFCVSRRRRKMYCGHARLCVCVCVCVSVRGRTPTLLNGPGCNLGAW